MKRFFLAGLVAAMFFACVSGMAQASPILWETNGHYYDAISYPSGITWTDAKQVAANSNFSGFGGHLATITSMDENLFIIRHFDGPIAVNTFLLGGYQPAGSPEPSGNWQWITGEPWSFTNWANGTPNDLYSGAAIFDPVPNTTSEDVLHLWGNNGTWNDVPHASGWGGFIVEYEPSAEPSAVPEPSTYILLGIALGAVGFTRRKMNRRE
jgi:hypothetical protein